MSITILLANILTLLAFFIHTIMGDKELHLIEPTTGHEEKREKWTMARCGWHWVSIDLLLASIGLGLINFTSYFDNEKVLLQILVVYFFGYAGVWIVTIVISKQFTKNYLKLGQWILLLVIAFLIQAGLHYGTFE